MNLFVQVPCLNEEMTLPEVIRNVPRQIPGVDEVKVLVVDDGSTDRTSEVARQAGADYVVRLPHNQGLANAFSIGLDTSLRLGADLIVSTDADHQYDGKDIPRLIQPLLEARADIVIGDRQLDLLKHFSLLKRTLQRLGSRTVSVLASIDVPDATSGFRAYTRNAALRVNVFSQFSYTLETIIQAGKNHMTIVSVPIQANPPTRPSRLFSSMGTYLQRSIATLLRVYALYEPLRTFFYVGGFIGLLGTAGVARFLYYWWLGSIGHVQSLVLSGVLLLIGFQLWMLGIVADLISANRRLSEDILYRMKRQQMATDQERWQPGGLVQPPLDPRQRAEHLLKAPSLPDSER